MKRWAHQELQLPYLVVLPTILHRTKVNSTTLQPTPRNQKLVNGTTVMVLRVSSQYILLLYKTIAGAIQNIEWSLKLGNFAASSNAHPILIKSINESEAFPFYHLQRHGSKVQCLQLN